MIGTKRLREIEAREKAANDGPWTAMDPAWDDSWYVAARGPGDPSVADCNFWSMSRKGNAAFIAAARQDVPDLCAEVRRLVKALADIRVEKAKFDACKLRVEELDAVIAIDDIAERALDGYEVDDGR